jgi:hypothetical protein
MAKAHFVIFGVMPGQKRVFALDVPGIHVLRSQLGKDVDGRDEPGHDELRAIAPKSAQKSPHFLVISALWG